MNRGAVVLLVLLLGACGGPKFTWPEFRSAPTPPDAVGTNALILASTDTLTFDVDDNTVSAKLLRYRRIKIFTPDGVRSGEVRLPFSARMRLVAFDGRTHVQDGVTPRIVRAPLDEITLKKPHAAEGINDVGEAIFTLPEAAPGAVLEYFALYEIPDAQTLEPILLREALAAERAELLIVTPKGMDLDLRYLVNGTTRQTAPIPAAAPKPEQTAYRYVETKVPPLLAEELGPSLLRTGPAVWPVYRGMRGGKGPKMERWEDVSAWVKRKFGIAPAKGQENDPDKLQAAFAAEAIKMRVVDNGLRLGERDAKIATDRVGAGLALYDALAARGFNVSLGLVSRESAGLLLPEVPSPAMFDAVIVAASVAGRTIYLDPACPACPQEQVSQGLEGAPVVALFADAAKVDTLPRREPKDNAFSITLSSKIGTRGDVQGSAQVVLSGYPAASARSAYLRRETKAVARELGFLDTLEVIQPQAPEGAASHLTFEMTFDFKAHCKEEPGAKLRCGVGNFMDRALPELWREARTQDLLVPTTFQHQIVATYQIPPKAQVELPLPMTAKNRFGEYLLTYQTQPGQLSLTRRLVLNTRRVSAEDYDDFYKFVQQVRQFDTLMPLVDLFPPEDAPQKTPEPENKPLKKRKKKR